MNAGQIADNRVALLFLAFAFAPRRQGRGLAAGQYVADPRQRAGLVPHEDRVAYVQPFTRGHGQQSLSVAYRNGRSEKSAVQKDMYIQNKWPPQHASYPRGGSARYFHYNGLFEYVLAGRTVSSPIRHCRSWLGRS